MSASPNIIEIKGIKKQFGNNKVLHDISLKLTGGKVLALMGANGAGKSTLVKILSGVYNSDDGSVFINGTQWKIDTPQKARAAGIITVHQSINDGVVQDLSVAENLLLNILCSGNFPTLLNKTHLHNEAAVIAKHVNLELPLHKQVSQLSQADKQMISIARALSEKPKLLILDEPTSSLSEIEAARLFKAVLKMKELGVAVIYISHRMSDIKALSDEIAALREGRIVGTFLPPLDFNAAVDSMLGHAVGDISHKFQAGTDEVIRLSDIKLKDDTSKFDLSFKKGEVVVLTGLLSSGCTSVIEALFGTHKFSSGNMYLNGKLWEPKSPCDSIENGIFMIQEDRGNNAVIPDFSIEQNTSLPFLKKFSKFGFINRKKEKRKVKDVIELTKVKYTDQTDLISTLSGGNQQKTMLARWLIEECKVLLLNEPFQGVDISSRRQIGKLLRETSSNRATLVICTDIEEAFEIADRILVFNHNELAGIHRIDEIEMQILIKQIAAAPKQKNDLEKENETQAKTPSLETTLC